MKRMNIRWFGSAVVALAICPVVVLAQNRPDPGGTDLSGVERFLEVSAILEQDKEPAPAQWDALFATPGYAVLIEREFRRADFEDRFRLAFMPARAAELEARVKKDTYDARMLSHYVKAKGRRAEIERRLSQYRADRFADEALARARPFLPAPPPAGQPTVAFVVFAADARGYDPVVIDILYLDEREAFLDLAAHEFHHWYRARLAPDLTRDVDTLWVLQQIHLEGTADLINMPGRISKPPESLSATDRQFVEFYRGSAENVRAIDALLSRMQDGGDRRELGQQLRRIVPRSGHPTGYYMAQTIVAALGRQAIVQTVANPFGFFRLYHQAAAKRGDGSPRLSAKALDLLAALEKRYAS